MTPDQLPAGLPMDDKIEAWVQQAMQLADARELARSNVAQSFWSNEAKEQLARASDDLAAHLRTTPEGFVMAKAEPVAELERENEALRKDAERYRWLRMNRLWLKANLPMIAAPQFDAAIDAAIDASLKEQSKC